MRAFTLVELAIVLVIIGLLVGGVLTGRDLIRTAAISSVNKDLETIKASIYTFKNKYNCLPGDCSKATSFGLGVNGDGNDRIGQENGFQLAESFQMWRHLSVAGLISGTYTGVAGPGGSRHAIPGQNVMAAKTFSSKVGYTLIHWGGYTNTYDFSPPLWGTKMNHMIMFGATHLNIYETMSPAFSAQEARVFDSKFDDGKAGQGNITAFWQPSMEPDCTTSADPAVTDYTDSTDVVCTMAFWLPF